MLPRLHCGSRTETAAETSCELLAGIGGHDLRWATASDQRRPILHLVFAGAALRSQSYLGARYRYLRAKLGGLKAVKAMARVLACLYYRLVTKGQVWIDRGTVEFEQRRQQRDLASLQRKARSLGMQLVPAAEQPPPQLTTLYHNDGGTPFPYWNILLRPAGAINASARDMGAYLQFYLNRGMVGGVAVMPSAAIDRMETPTRTWQAQA